MMPWLRGLCNFLISLTRIAKVVTTHSIVFSDPTKSYVVCHDNRADEPRSCGMITAHHT
jgi:hypothetical protein